MQTVNFKCGHCGQVMAVGRENLGQQVRCPHCQQVVHAPTSESPAPAPAPPSPFGNLDEHEDIFTQKRDTDDVLFGRAEGPRLEIPRDPEPSPPTVGFNGLSASNLPLETVAPEAAPAPGPVSDPAPLANEPETVAPEQPWSPASDGAAANQGEAPSYVPSPSRSRERKESFVSPAFLLLVFAPTVLWALGATGIAFWLYGKAIELRNVPEKSPFDEMIDDGDFPGVKAKDKAKVRTKMDTTEKFATSPLPERLQTTIDQPITVGDLRITPRGVFRRPVEIVVDGSKPAECRFDSLVLELKFENLNSEYAFAPLDTYFDRQYKGIGRPPLTLLQAGDKTLYGGSHEWYPIYSPGDRRWKPRQRPLERKKADSVALQPGETVESYVCTDGWNEKTADFLFGNKDKKVAPYSGPMLWRVHVRRGPHEHRGRMLSATAVIGVAFDTTKIIDEQAKRKDW